MSKLNFQAWLAECDRQAWATIGCSTSDLPDWDWWNAWNDGMSPGRAVREALKAAGGF